MSCMLSFIYLFFVFKQKTAYEMRISDWSSDVCSSDLPARIRPSRQFIAANAAHEHALDGEGAQVEFGREGEADGAGPVPGRHNHASALPGIGDRCLKGGRSAAGFNKCVDPAPLAQLCNNRRHFRRVDNRVGAHPRRSRTPLSSEEHTSEL